MDLKALGSLTSLGGIGGLGNAKAANPTTGFGELVQQAIGNTMQAQKNAESNTLALAQGQDIPMQDVIQSVGKAEMTLQTMVAVRDRAVEAYLEIQRMPI